MKLPLHLLTALILLTPLHLEAQQKSSTKPNAKRPTPQKLQQPEKTKAAAQDSTPSQDKPATSTATAKAPGPVVSLKPEALQDFDKQPAEIRSILENLLALTERNLGYQSASADPNKGGMDCSGSVYYVLQTEGWQATPRQSDEMYAWTWKAGTFRSVNGRSWDSFEFQDLRPGDLLFWTNTTAQTDRDPAVTHVMIYLGRQKSDGRRVMAGSSDGRTYDGVPRFGVSVFDFLLPKEGGTARFIGYAHLPGMK